MVSKEFLLFIEPLEIFKYLKMIKYILKEIKKSLFEIAKIIFVKMIYAKNYDLKHKTHLVIYANGYPYILTKKFLIFSSKLLFGKNLHIHSYKKSDIKNLRGGEEFEKLKKLPFNPWARDGYYNAYKPLIVRDVYEKIQVNEVLFYLDCSRHFVEGFKYNLNKLVDLAMKEEFIAGSCSSELNNEDVGFRVHKNSNEILQKIWDKLIGGTEISVFKKKKHILNTWFLLKKNSKNINQDFIDEWVFFCFYKEKNETLPLIAMHHTVDQFIFNFLVFKYQLSSFHCDYFTHTDCKSINKILKYLNSTNFSLEKYLQAQ